MYGYRDYCHCPRCGKTLCAGRSYTLNGVDIEEDECPKGHRWARASEAVARELGL